VHGTPGGIRTRDLSFNRRSNSDLHHGSCETVWRGTDDAVAAREGRRPFGRRESNPLGVLSAFPRSNRHLHHRHSLLRANTKKRRGTFETVLPFRAMMLYQAELLRRLRAAGRIRTADPHLSEVTVVFTTGLRCACARAISIRATFFTSPLWGGRRAQRKRARRVGAPTRNR
jgi:hypothetical protein